MTGILKIAEGVISTAANTAESAAQTAVTMPAEMEAAIPLSSFVGEPSGGIDKFAGLTGAVKMEDGVVPEMFGL